MLDLVDNLILQILDTGWDPLLDKPQFSFAIPDEDWQAKVKSGSGLYLNIYLYEVSENRNFRRGSWDNVELSDGSVALSQPPTYLDCHYLISAWSRTEDSEMASPILDEHQVLSEAMRVLLRNPDVVPLAVGVPGGGLVFQNAHVYLTVAPPEPPRISNDFWSTMKLPWRPAVMLVVTAPLDVLRDSPSSPVVTTLIQRYAPIGSSVIEESISIGGRVVKAADQSPIAGATVARLDSNDTATTDAQGRYAFTGIQRGVHGFRASAAGMTPIQRNIDIPDDLPGTHVFELAP
ncbi:Pvc16 family protein [Bradyrhizobium diazoefficiens]